MALERGVLVKKPYGADQEGILIEETEDMYHFEIRNSKGETRYHMPNGDFWYNKDRSKWRTGSHIYVEDLSLEVGCLAQEMTWGDLGIVESIDKVNKRVGMVINMPNGWGGRKASVEYHLYIPVRINVKCPDCGSFNVKPTGSGYDQEKGQTQNEYFDCRCGNCISDFRWYVWHPIKPLTRHIDRD